MHVKITTWGAVKWCSVLFNSVATWTVFHTQFYAALHAESIAYLSAALAIILIDLLYVALINFIEAPTHIEEKLTLRFPYVVGLTILYFAIVAIGFLAEGWLALAPRVGLGIITLICVNRYIVLYLDERDRTWQERYDKRKYRAERQDSLILSKAQRKIKHQEQLNALKFLKGELKEKYVSNLRDQLGITTPVVEETKLLPASSTTDLLSEFIQKTNTGYAWVNPFNPDEIHATTAAGEPYSLSGAKIALARCYNTRIEPDL